MKYDQSSPDSYCRRLVSSTHAGWLRQLWLLLRNRPSEARAQRDKCQHWPERLGTRDSGIGTLDSGLGIWGLGTQDSGLGTAGRAE